MSTTQHTIFTQNLSTLNTSSKEKESEPIVKFLDYSTIDAVPEEFKKQLDNQGLPSNYELSSRPIICGYLKNHDNLPFIAYLELSNYSNSIDNATLKYWTADGNYCLIPFNKAKKLTFEHLQQFRLGEYFSKKTQTTSNGVLNETVDDPFLKNPLYSQECVGDFSTIMNLCRHSRMFEHKIHNLEFDKFFNTVINFYGIGDPDFTSLIAQSTDETDDFPTAFQKVLQASSWMNPSSAYLLSIAQHNNKSQQRISYLFESQEASKTQKPLMIYTRVFQKETRYLKSNSGDYIKLDPNDIVLKPNGYNCFRVLNYEKVVEGFPTDVSEDTKKLVANPFPPELAIINAEAIKRYNESLQDKTITPKNTGLAYE